MKFGLFYALIFLFFSLPAFGELSPTDLEKINAMFKESEARMKEYVTQEISKINHQNRRDGPTVDK